MKKPIILLLCLLLLFIPAGQAFSFSDTTDLFKSALYSFESDDKNCFVGDDIHVTYSYENSWDGSDTNSFRITTKFADDVRVKEYMNMNQSEIVSENYIFQAPKTQGEYPVSLKIEMMKRGEWREIDDKSLTINVKSYPDITINTDEEDVFINFNDKSYTTGSSNTVTIEDIEPDKHTFIASKTGFYDYYIEIDAREGDVEESISMYPKQQDSSQYTTSAIIKSNLKDVDITFDNDYFNTGFSKEVTIEDLKVGKLYEFTAKKEDYRDNVKTFTSSPNGNIIELIMTENPSLTFHTISIPEDIVLQTSDKSYTIPANNSTYTIPHLEIGETYSFTPQITSSTNVTYTAQPFEITKTPDNQTYNIPIDVSSTQFMNYGDSSLDERINLSINVLDKNNQPINDAIVYVDDISKSTQTKNLVFETTKGSHTVKVTHPSYYDYEKVYTINDDSSLTITLNEGKDSSAELITVDLTDKDNLPITFILIGGFFFILAAYTYLYMNKKHKK